MRPAVASRKRGSSHPFFWVTERFRQAHQRAIDSARREACMRASEILLPLSTLTMLLANAIGPAATAAYEQALLECLSWLRLQGVSRVETLAGVDLCMAKFLDEPWMHMAPYAVGEKTMAACGHLTPATPGSLAVRFPGAARALKVWKRFCQARTRATIPFLALILIVAQLLLRHRKEMALAVMLAFSGYLRPSEVSNLGAEQVVEPQEHGSAHFSFVAVVLHHFSGLMPSKVGVFDESIVLDSHWLCHGATTASAALARGQSAGA